MASKPDGLDLSANAELIGVLNSRGPLVHAGRVTVRDVMAAAQESIRAFSSTTETNPGPVLNGVTERRYQEALSLVLEAINSNQPIKVS